MLERCVNDTKYGGKDDATRWRPLYKQQDLGPLEHKIMQLGEEASEPSRLSWLETRGSSLSRVKVATQNFASVDAI